MKTNLVGTIKSAAIVAASAAFVLASAAVSSAATITISDLSEGSPTYTVSSDIDITGVTIGPETLTLTGIFHIPFGNGRICNQDAACDQGFNLLETAGGALSDTVRLTIPYFDYTTGSDF